MIKLFVSGFPLEITELELAKLIGPHGEIATIKIVRDKKTRICKGYAFVEVVSQEDADSAVLALHGQAMLDRELTVKISEEKMPAEKSNFSRPAKPFLSTDAKRPTSATEDRIQRPRRPRIS